MNYFLGLDLGSGSIGWAVIEKQNGIPVRIIALGSRIVPLTPNESDNFSQGKAVSINQQRTQKRTARKTLDRYQMRRALLCETLTDNDMNPTHELMCASKEELWKMRSDAATQQISLKEIGRVLYHINQKRGFKLAKNEASSTDKTEQTYIQSINQRCAAIAGITIGQYIYSELIKNPEFRYRQLVYSREKYIEEYDTIMKCQQQFYPDVLTDELISKIRNEIIFYQRKLKSCKHLVSYCNMELHEIKVADGRIVISGPKTAPKSSPLAQVCKVWESINNIVLCNKKGDTFSISDEQRMAIFQFMERNEKLKVTNLYKILGISKKDGWWGGKAIGTGLQGDTTRIKIEKALNGKYPHLLKFDIDNSGKCVNKDTGEELPCVKDTAFNEPLFKLWHTLYSISDIEELKAALRKNFNITDEYVLDNLSSIDFVKEGYANKSHKYMRKILPQLQKGVMYAHACEIVGSSNCSDYKATKRANNGALLLSPIAKGELRQPVVEKVLNQMVNVVNALIEKYGEFEEIRVELARDLKQNREERNEDYKRMTTQNKKNLEIAERIQQEYKLYPTKARIRKYRMWEETEHRCIYCGAPVSIKEFLSGIDAEKEHIIPRSLLFNDSFSNTTCACRSCNHDKGQMTGFDYAESKGKAFFDDYINRINKLADKKEISRSKFKNLTTKREDIPQDFIERQLRETQYISRKAVEMLQSLYADKPSGKLYVKTSGGIITDFLRHQWGWDTVLHQSNFKRFEKAGLIENVPVITKGEKHFEKRIIGWNKRIDNRHHAIDALTVACTQQSHIQRLNTLNANKEAFTKLDATTNEGYRAFIKRVAQEAPFTTAEVLEAADNIIVSFKPITKSTTPGKRKVFKNGKPIIKQTGILVPRGELTEETVYGLIQRYDGKGGFNACSVVRYPLSKITSQADANSIVDEGIKQIVKKRLKEHNDNPKIAFSTPLYSDVAQTKEIKGVRCFSGHKRASLAIVKRDENGKPIGFSPTGNNHHAAFYLNENGKPVELVCSFYHAIQRRLFNIPTIIENPSEVWDLIETSGKEYSEEFLSQLPNPKWTFAFSLQRNEMVIIGLTKNDFEYALQNGDKKTLAQHLYKVQSISHNSYCFTRHTETKYDKKHTNKADERFMRYASASSLLRDFTAKVSINVIGDIIEK